MLEYLFQPIVLGPVTLRNRIVSSANYSAMAENGFFGDRITRYHSEKAKGGVALTITEELAVHPSTQYGLAANVRAFEIKPIPGCKIFTKAIQDQGAKTFGQLWHGGINVCRGTSNLTFLPKLPVSNI